MNKIELRARKNTTKNAVKQALNFFENFDFSDYEDVKTIHSSSFSVNFKGYEKEEWEGRRFVVENGELKIEAQRLSDNKCRCFSISEVLDDTCYYCSFGFMMDAFENILSKLDGEVSKKEIEIVKFLEFIENYKNHTAAVAIAKQVEDKEEHL